MIKLSLAYGFRKMFFNGQNLKHVYMTIPELLIFIWLTQSVWSFRNSRLELTRYSVSVFEVSEAVVQRFSVQVFLENSQENTCADSLFQ